jgi:predicted AAA+ superfamily ATPase
MGLRVRLHQKFVLGFPEPYIKKSETFLRRWQRERRSRVVNQDLSGLANVKEISLLELLADLLPSKVGSPLSIKSIQEDLEVSPNTVSSWIQLLELVYYCYRIAPFGPPNVRAVKKTNKLYLWDWSEVKDRGARRENLVASHLLKYCPNYFSQRRRGVATSEMASNPLSPANRYKNSLVPPVPGRSYSPDFRTILPAYDTYLTNCA